ncbi:hypothetical protein C8R44DRAFT_71304 [Mycena epipterygia]|nr:hypothetical protein C8R44DRAFT_71304 [Mycena epipterygia]
MASVKYPARPTMIPSTPARLLSRSPDASTTLELGRALRVVIDVSRLTTIVFTRCSARSMSSARVAWCTTAPPTRRATTSCPSRASTELAAHFLASLLMPKTHEDVTAYHDKCVSELEERVQQYKRSAQAEHAKGARRASKAAHDVAPYTRVVMLRRVQIIMGSKATNIRVVNLE